MPDDVYAKPIAYTIPERPMKLERDVVYKTVGDGDLVMDIYAPETAPPEAGLPVVVFVHGGPIPADLPLQPKNWGIFKSYGKLVVASGFAGVTFNHRLYAFEGYAQSVRDINHALRFLIENHDRYRIDPNRVFIWGFSGAGPLMGQVALENVSNIRGWLAFYAHLDLTNIAHQLADKLSDEEINQFSTTPILEHPDASQIPVFIARAGQDRAVLNEAIDMFVQKAVDMNRPITFVNHPTGRHGFDILDNDERTHEIIEMALLFLKSNISY